MKGSYPAVSVVIPVKRSQNTIRQTLDSLLAQDYPGDVEILVIGDYHDPTWSPVEDLIYAGKVRVIEVDVDGPGRDSNAKRNLGLQNSTGDIIALTDGDIVLPSNWISKGVELVGEGWGYISGSVRSTDDGFWGGFMDNNAMVSKTPDIMKDYVLDSQHFGQSGLKPPITGNTFVTRAVIEDAGELDPNFVTSYEDYEWARRVVDHGHQILRTGSLVAQHHHRKGFKSLIREHHRSGSGCGDYVFKHPHCQFGKRRLKQLAMVYLMGTMGVLAAVGCVLFPAVLIASTTVACGLMLFSAWKTKSVAGATYPFIAFIFGLAFCVGLTRRLRKGRHTVPPTRVLASNSLAPQSQYQLEEGS